MWRDRIEAQPMFDVLSMANSRVSLGNYVARMEIGDTPGFRNDLLHDLISKFSKSEFRYSPSQGEVSLRESVVASQWPDENPKNIVIGPANFLITAALAACTAPKDFILLPDPGFPTYRLSANFLDLRILYYPPNDLGTTEFTNLDSFVKDLHPKPKAIIINNPSNPLGVAFPGNKVSHALRNFQELGISIILDETYINLVYVDTKANIDGIPATRIRTLSKEHCAPGLRVGYACSDTATSQIMSNLMSMSISCIPQFIQLAVAEYLLSQDSITFVNEVKKEMKKRIQFLLESIPSGSIPIVPNAAFYAMLRVGDSERAFQFLLDQNVSTCPGIKFGSRAKEYLRISLAGEKHRFFGDISMLVNALERLGNS